MAARCRKFVPNLFNKTKCQSCFGAKEAHTAAALESSKAARKISKCAYLFVSPDLDFTNPLHRTKRWQRRFFILYDDGELTYSVDDNPGTIPQGSVDMNKCTDVFDAEERTGHEYSIGITVPNQPSSFVKGTSKDEIQRWFDVLVMYPRSLTIKTKRSPGSKPGSGTVARHLSYYPSGTEKSVSDDEDADSVHSKDGGDAYERSSRTRGRYKQRDMRRSKSEVRPSDLRLAEDEYNKKLGDGASAGSQSQLGTKLPKDKNIDGLPVRKAGEPETFSSVRSMKHRKAAKSHHQSTEGSKSPAPSAATPITPLTTAAPATHLTAVTPTSATPMAEATSPALAISDSPDSSSVGADDPGGGALSRRLSIPNMSSVPKLAGHKSVGRTASAADAASGGAFSAFVYPPAPSTASTSLTGSNETDEHKIAKNEHARKSLEKSPIVRKGWLLVRKNMDTNVWSKHWFVLCGTSLSYYKDAKAEDSNQLDGVIDVASAYEVSTVKAERNHGFKIKTKEGEYILSAMTSGIRRNWIDAVEGIIAEIRRAREKSARQDMGFVFESPIRSPRTPSAAASQPVTPMAPVVPDPSSRVNSALREMAERRRETGDDKPLEELYKVVPAKERKDSTCSDTEREVSALTSRPELDVAALQPLRQPSDIAPPSPKSPSAIVSPSQRIKEKSRAKTPPRARSPPPPSSVSTPSSSHLLLAPNGSTAQPSMSQAVSSPAPSPRMLSTRIPSPHIPSPLPTHVSNPRSSHNATPVDRMMLLPTGNSSDENDDSLTAKLLQSNTQVQRLEQVVQDVNSTVRKQVVEIESLQTKLDLTTSQLRDMETALTHSAQNLNKERRNTSRLTEALDTLKREQASTGDYQGKCSLLEKQLEEATHKLAAQELKMGSVEEKTGKLATLEKVLTNTRRHLQDAVDNGRETELHYQSKLEELERDFEEEKLEWQEKLHKMEERLDSMVTVSNNSVNADLSGQLLKEKSQNVQRLEELVKEQKGKIDQLTEENVASRQRVDELQCYKDRAAVKQNQLDTVQQENSMLQTEFQSLRNDLGSVMAELAARDSELAAKDGELASKCQENARLVANIAQLEEQRGRGEAEVNDSVADSEQAAELAKLTSELDSLRHTTADLQQKLQHSNTQIETLTANCQKSEHELMKERSKPPPPPVTTAACTDGFTLAQVVELVGAVARCCERMTESAVAMLAGEMIETDIKATINFNQEQRGVLGNKIAEQLVKKFSGVRQRLNYIVKHSVSKKQFDNLHIQNEALAQQLAECEESASPRSETRVAAESAPGEADYLSALLEQCRAEILCISTDITRLDISHVETRLQSLNTTLSELQQRNAFREFSAEASIEAYCNKLAVQAAATYELARCVSDSLDVSQALISIENCLKSTSGLVTSIEDISLRNYALLVAERLLISYELDHLILTGQWKGFIHNQSDDMTRMALVTETMHRIDAFSMSKGQPLADAFLNSCLNNLLQQNINGRPTLDMLRNETSLIATLLKSVSEALTKCVREYVSLYTSDLVNFGTVEIGEVESLLDGITSSLCKQIKLLVSTGNLSSISTEWLHNRVCESCERAKGLEAKDMPSDVAELALKLCMFESKFNSFSCLITSSETSTLSQSLISEASKLAGLSAELAKKSAVEGSTESKIAFLAHRLDKTDRLLATCTGRYSDTVQQVMREVVHNMQISVLRYQLDAGGYPASPIEQSLTQQVESLKLKLHLANQRNDKLVNVSQHEKTVEALHDEMSLLKVEHSTELDESKRDMKMVLKSVKAEEYRMATEMTKHIADLEGQLADEQRARQAAEQKLERCRPDSVPLEEHAQLKEKVRDLENCLHEMQEEFEEELYQERADHMAELEKSRAELLALINKSDSQQLVAQDVQEQYKAVIDKLKAEQASLQQWIDDIREAHRDEIDALQHERDNALADEMLATQTALESMRSGHLIEVEQMEDKVRELEEKAAKLLQAERDLLLHSRESANKDERISQLNAKVSSANKKLAKLELSSSKSSQAVAELTAINRQLTERNSQLVERFTHEISKGTGSSSGLDLALRAQLDTVSEKLKLEQLRNSQLENEVEAVRESHKQLLQQQEEDTSLQVSVSVSPSEEMFVRRKLRGRSRSPLSGASPSTFTKANMNNNNNNNVTHETSALPQAEPSVLPKSPAVSPRKPANKAYDLSRSKSAVTIGKQPTLARSKRLSNPGDAARAIVLDTNDRGFQQYQKSGGMSIADRMRKFT